MTIELTYLERLHPRAVLGQWRGWGHSELRRVWALMDRLELNAEEKLAINHRVIVRDGDEREIWDAVTPNPPAPVSFDFHDRDVARIAKALQGMPWAGGDRVWAARLLDAFCPADNDE